MKTRLQENRGTKLGLVATARAVWAQGGVRAFYKGFSACLLRAFPANAVQFSVNDWTTKRLRGHYLGE